jgi:hypothetical protein
MNKLLKTLMTFIFAATAITSANSIELRVGATGNAAAFYGNADEILKDSERKSSDEVLAGFSYASVFTEVAFEQAMGLTIGLEYTPDSIAMDKTTRTISDQDTNSTVRTGNDSGDQIIDVQVSDLVTAYVQVPLMSTGVYAKVGYIQATVETKEVLATGSTYKNVDLDGMEYGLGYMGELSDMVFYKLESTYIDFDDISAVGSEEGVAASGSFNKITAEAVLDATIYPPEISRG